MDTELYSRQAEEALAGSILIDSGEMALIDLQPEAIHTISIRWIWQAAKRLTERSTEVDIVTISDELERAGQLSEIGGSAYLAGLINITPTSMGACRYAEIIKDYSRRRQLVQSANDLAKAAHADGDYSEAVARVVDALTTGVRPSTGAVHWSEFISQLYDQVVERAANPKDTWGIPTGILDFDKATGGLHPGEVVYIAGEPGIGKSILSMQMGINMGKAGHPGAIYSLEMGGVQVTRRAISALSKIETRKIKTGRLDDSDYPRFVAAIDEASNYPIYICEEADLTTSALRADLSRLKLQYGVEWAVIDYMLLMTDLEGKLEETERSALLSRRIKTIARKVNIPIITVNSVTKDGMGGDAKPTQKNVRGSGQVIHDADIIGFLTQHIPDKFDKVDANMRTFTFGKGRELETKNGHFHLVALEKYPAFGDAQPNQFAK